VLAQARTRDLFLLADLADQLPNRGGKTLGRRRTKAADEQLPRDAVVVDDGLDLPAERPSSTSMPVRSSP